MILLYHNIIPDDSPPERMCIGQALTRSAFERQMRWLATRYCIVSTQEYLDNLPSARKLRMVAITFDDGTRVTFDCAFPILAGLRIPATFFITTGHIEHGELLWFNCLKALCFEKTYHELELEGFRFSLHTLKQRKAAWENLVVLANAGDPKVFTKRLLEKYPIPKELFSLYEGMTWNQIDAVCQSDIVEVGSHTLTHPYLCRISKEEQEREILESGRILFDHTGIPVRYFAYPSGEYDANVLDVTRRGYTAAFAVISQNLDMNNPEFEIQRFGIYSPSLLKLGLKLRGFSKFEHMFRDAAETIKTALTLTNPSTEEKSP